MRLLRAFVGVVLLLAAAEAVRAAETLGELPPNLAQTARISANSEQGHLPAANVADGRIVDELVALGEMGSWAVDGNVTQGSGEITFTWEEPVELAEVVYFGRCSWQLQEAFKDYEIYVEGNDEPVASGSFEMTGRGQPVTFDPVTAKSLTIKFANSHGGPNPGANEIMLFPSQLDEAQLERITSFRLNSLIADHMVYQQGKPARVWGTAADGEEVTVEFAGNTVTTTAEDGRWLAELPVAELGQSGEILVTSAAGTYTVSDVLVGEVWIASGQSNMEMPVAPSYWPSRYDGVANYEAEVAAADYPEIRCFYVPRVASQTPRDDTGGAWRVCTPETAGGFTAVGYFFARKLYEELEVPIAIVDASWGATYIEPWTSQEGFDGVPELAEQAQQARDENAAFLEQQKADPTVSPNTHQHQITALYKGMIHRLTPFGIRGAIWYQGEGNVGNRMAYYHKMQALIEGWREAWGEGDFPFLYVQLAPYNYGQYKGSKNNYHLPALWEAQTAALSVPNTGMAVTTDISDVGNIHPPNKQDVGLRLALWALALAYDRDDVAYSGPIFESFEVEGDSIRIRWKFADGGLESNDEAPLTWFTIAGEDQVFHEATAEIDGDTVVVHSDEVPNPVAVRFGWHKLAEPNLTGSTGLPAVSFRTDDWDVQIGLVEDE